MRLAAQTRPMTRGTAPAVAPAARAAPPGPPPGAGRAGRAVRGDPSARRAADRECPASRSGRSRGLPCRAAGFVGACSREERRAGRSGSTAVRLRPEVEAQEILAPLHRTRLLEPV